MKARQDAAQKDLGIRRAGIEAFRLTEMLNALVPESQIYLDDAARRHQVSVTWRELQALLELFQAPFVVPAHEPPIAPERQVAARQSRGKRNGPLRCQPSALAELRRRIFAGVGIRSHPTQGRPGLRKSGIERDRLLVKPTAFFWLSSMRNASSPLRKAS